MLSGILSGGIPHSAASQTPSTSGIQWMSYDEGRQRGQAENKKLFLVFSADWCRYCLQMKKETFQDPTVIAYINRNFIPIKVNSDRQQNVAAEYGVRGCPAPGLSLKTESGSATGPALSMPGRC